MTKLEKIGLRVFVWLSIILGFLEFGFWRPAHCAENDTVVLIAGTTSITVPKDIYDNAPTVVSFHDRFYDQWVTYFCSSIQITAFYPDSSYYLNPRNSTDYNAKAGYGTSFTSVSSISTANRETDSKVYIFKGVAYDDLTSQYLAQGVVGGLYDQGIPTVVLTPRDGNLGYDITYPENYDSDRYSVAIDLEAYAPNPSDIFLDGFNDYLNAAVMNYRPRMQSFFLLRGETNIIDYYKDRKPWDQKLFSAWYNTLNDLSLTRTLTHESETNEPTWDMSNFISLKVDDFTPYFSNVMGSANGLFMAFYSIRPKRIVATVIDNDNGNRGSSYVITFDQQGHVLANGLFGNNQSSDFDSLISGAKDNTINELNRQIRELQTEIEYLNYVNENFAGVSTDADIGKTFVSTVTGLIDTFKSLPQIGRVISTGLDFIPLEIRNVIYFGIFAIVIISLYKALRG